MAHCLEVNAYVIKGRDRGRLEAMQKEKEFLGNLREDGIIYTNYENLTQKAVSDVPGLEGCTGGGEA